MDLCAQHNHLGADPDRLSAPEGVLVKVRLNPRWSERLTQAGVALVVADHEARDARHREQAQVINRSADAYKREGRADSGVAVFGRDGLEGTSLEALIVDLLAPASGYVITRAVVEPGRNGDRMSQLVLAFGQSGERVQIPHTALEAVKALGRSRWDHVHVWSNPPRTDGKRVDTVNASHRSDAPAQWNLRFDSGFYCIDPA